MSFRKTPLMIALSLLSALLLSFVAAPTASAMEVGDPVIYESEATAAPTQGADPDSDASPSASVIAQETSEPISLRLAGQGLGEPRVHVAYRQYSAYGGGFTYKHIWQESLSPVITAMTDGWLISLANLDFNGSDSYIVGISTGNALFTREVTEADLGQEIVLTTAGHIPLQLSLPFVPTAVPEIRLSRPDGDTAWFAGAVAPGALVPCAFYNAQVLFWQPDAAYSLIKSGHQHSPQFSTISFALADIVPITINLPAEDAVIFGFTYLANTPFGDTAWPGWRQTSPGHYRACITAGEYETFRVQVHLQGYVYTWEEHDLWVGDELRLGDLQLQATLNLSKHMFSPGETISYSDNGFGILDGAGRSWTVRDNADWRVLRGEVALIGVGANASPGEVVLPFVNGEITLPTEPEGQYQLVYRLQEGPLTVQSSVPRYITVADLTNRIVLQITGEALAGPMIHVHYREESGEGGFAFRFLKNADIGSDVSPIPGGWRIVLPQLDFELSSSYRFGCSAGNAVFTRELTAADVGQTISLAVGADHVPLKLSLPVEPTGTPYMLLSCMEDGQAWHCGDGRDGLLVPPGSYSAQVLFSANGIPYTLLAGHEHRADHDTLVIDAAEVALASITIPVPDAQVSYLGSLVEPPLGMGMSRPWVKQPTGQYVSGISLGRYKRLEVDVYVPDGWSYVLKQPGLEVTGDLDLGYMHLQGALKPAKTTFLPGETIQHSAEQFGVTDKAGRVWEVFGPDHQPAGCELVFIAPDQTVTPVPFINGAATLPPNLYGVYQMFYRVLGSPVPVYDSPAVPVVIGEQNDTTITGELLLSATAADELTVCVTALDVTGQAVADTTVTISAGQSAAEFSLQLPAGVFGCHLIYSISGGDGRYIDQAYYHSQYGSIIRRENASLVLPTSHALFKVQSASTYDSQIRLRLPLGHSTTVAAVTMPYVYYTLASSPRYVRESTCTWSADLQVSGWTIGISGLTFDSSRPGYTVAVSAGTAMYIAEIGPEDQGKLLTLATDTLLPLELGSLPPGLSAAYHKEIYLHFVDEQGEYFFCGAVEPGALVPAGIYHAMLNARSQQQTWVLTRTDHPVAPACQALSFGPTELARVTVQPLLPEHALVSWIEVSYYPLADCTAPLIPLQPDPASGECHFYLTQGDYAKVALQANLGGGVVKQELGPLVLNTDTADLSLDLRLHAYLNLPKARYAPGENLQFGVDFGLQDESDNSWQLYDYSGNLKCGRLVLSSPDGLACDLAITADGSTNLPALPGSYMLLYQPDSLFPVAQFAVASIIVADQEAAPISFQVEGGCLWAPQVEVCYRHYLNGAEFEYRRLPAEQLQTTISETDTGWVVSLSDLDFKLSPDYTVSISTGTAIFTRAVTKNDLYRPITLVAGGAEHLAVHLSLPFAPASTPRIFLQRREGQMAAYPVGMAVDGTLLPLGNYDLQVLAEGASGSYSLSRANYQHTLVNNTIAFASADIVPASITVPEGVTSVSSSGSLTGQQFQEQRMANWVEVEPNRYSVNLSVGEYSELALSVRAGDWEYRLKEGKTQLAKSRDYGTLTLQAAFSLQNPNLGFGATVDCNLAGFGAYDAGSRQWRVLDANQCPYSGRIKLTDQNQVSVSIAIQDGKFTLPQDLGGQYELVYHLDQGPLSIAPSTPLAVSIASPEPTALAGIWLGSELLPSFVQGATVFDAEFPPGNFYLAASAVDPTCSVQISPVPPAVHAGQVCITVTTADCSQSQIYLINFTTVCPSGDVNGDNKKDITDLALLALHYGARFGHDPGFSAQHDLNKDRVIDVYDLVILARDLLSPATPI